MNIRPAEPDDRSWIGEILRTRWGGTNMLVRGRLVQAVNLPALLVEREGRRCGLATYTLDGGTCEIITLDALEQRTGVGSALLEAVADEARRQGAGRLTIVTTNDNLDALRFYQRRGFRLAALRPGAIAEHRTLKPSIPATGDYGIPVCDELELERTLRNRE